MGLAPPAGVAAKLRVGDGVMEPGQALDPGTDGGRELCFQVPGSKILFLWGGGGGGGKKKKI